MLLLGGWEQKQFRSQLYLYCLWTLTCHSIKCEKREKLEVITLSAHHWRPPQTSPRIRQLTTWSKNWRQQTPEKVKQDSWIGLKLCWGRLPRGQGETFKQVFPDTPSSSSSSSSSSSPSSSSPSSFSSLSLAVLIEYQEDHLLWVGSLH